MVPHVQRMTLFNEIQYPHQSYFAQRAYNDSLPLSLSLPHSLSLPPSLPRSLSLSLSLSFFVVAMHLATSSDAVVTSSFWLLVASSVLVPSSVRSLLVAMGFRRSEGEAIHW